MAKYSLYVIGIALAVTISGCSVVESITGKKKESISTVNGTQAIEVEKKTDKNHTEMAQQVEQNSDSDKAREIPPILIHPSLIPSSTDTIAKTPANQTPSNVTSLSAIARVVGGNWTIVQVGSTVIDRDENMPYIVFEPSEGVFYANNGCNTLNGSYTIDGEKISFHNVLTTLRLCPDVTFDHEINTIIADESETNLKLSEVGNETILEFVTTTGKPLMRLRRGDLEFLNGQWEIKAVAGLEAMKTPATVFFDLNDMKLHGNTGCNFINGEIYLDHRMANAVDFSQIIVTMRACQYPEQQTAILVGLEETASAISDGTDRVVLLSSDGKILLELKKAPVNQ